MRPAVRTAALAAGALFAVAEPLPAATTWLQGRTFDQDGQLTGGGAEVTLGTGAVAGSDVGGGFNFVIDGLTAGTRDRLCANPLESGITCGETRYLSITPQTGRALRFVADEVVMNWRDSVSMTGDGTLGEIFGIVEDVSGAPVAGAIVTLDPPSGTLYYLDEDGSLDLAGPTFPNGRFIVVDSAAGPVTARAQVGASPAGTAYGVATDRQALFLTLSPEATIGGSVVDESGFGLAAATVSWDFDPSVTTASTGGGVWSLDAIARGLDLTVRGSAAGFKPARTFRRSEEETADAAAIEVRMLSTGSYTAIPSGFGLVQDPLLGMVIGRVLDADGTAVSEVVVSVDPAVGTVRYFDAAGAPDPSAGSTSTSGRFAVFNLPTGDVALSAVAPGRLIRRAVAPSVADAVTQGDLVGYRAQTVSGTVFDEAFRTDPVGGAVVQLVEFPSVSTIAGSDGTYTLDSVPMDTLVSFRVARAGFIDTYTFRRDSGSDPARTQDLFLATENSVVFLYSGQGLSFDRSRGLIGAEVRLSNEEGIIGLFGEAVPLSGIVSYPSFTGTGDATSILGNINILNVRPGEGGLVAVDPRSRFTLFELVPRRANGAVVDSMDIPCDTSPGALGNLYPCDGEVIRAGSEPMDFHWEGDGTGNLKWQVQFSNDPAFAEEDIVVTSRTSRKKFLKDKHWRPGKKKWRKKILPLGDGGATVYWRVLQRQRLSKKDKIETAGPPSSFTVE